MTLKIDSTKIRREENFWRSPDIISVSQTANNRCFISNFHKNNIMSFLVKVKSTLKNFIISLINTSVNQTRTFGLICMANSLNWKEVSIRIV